MVGRVQVLYISSGHDTKRCISLTNKIQDMFDAGEMKPPEERPSNKDNPLFSHTNFESENIVLYCSHLTFSDEPGIFRVRVYARRGYGHSGHSIEEPNLIEVLEKIIALMTSISITIAVQNPQNKWRRRPF